MGERGNNKGERLEKSMASGHGEVEVLRASDEESLGHFEEFRTRKSLKVEVCSYPINSLADRSWETRNSNEFCVFGYE